MTRHDRIRKERAESCNRDEMDSLMDAIGGLQSTDDPSLVPLHDELLRRWHELKEERDGNKTGDSGREE